MTGAYKITLNVLEDRRWQACIGPVWSGSYTLTCCERGHRSARGAMRHGFREIRHHLLLDLGDYDSETASYRASPGQSSRD